MKYKLLRISLLSVFAFLLGGAALGAFRAGETETTPSTDVTALWDFQNTNPSTLSSIFFQGTSGTVASTVEGIELTVDATTGKLQKRASDAQFNAGTKIQVPVKNKGDEVIVVSYPGYHNYTIAGTAAEKDTETYTATSADATAGYVEIESKGDSYLYSIQVTHFAPKAENIVEKSIYKTDFSDWEVTKPSDPATTVKKVTKYTKEDLEFTLFQTSVMSTDNSKFSAYTPLPHMTLCAEKEKDSYIITSKLSEITKVRFIHGATANNRGWKLEAKGDGDDDWSVISQATASPAGWSEVTAKVNKKNVQLRFTNLVFDQNAYLFELEIFGNVDLAGEPLLGSFKANGTAYAADEIFEMNNAGNYEGTIEVSKTATMISEANPLTDIVADNGKIGTVTYATTGEGADQKTIVTIPVTAEKGTVNYILTVVKKPDFTLTYYDVAGKEIGTQKVEKDAKIGKFDVNIDDVKAATEGYKARGWFKSNILGEKYSVDDVVTEDINLYAIETEIEVASDVKRYTFDLKSKTFYAEDHEAFSVEGSGKWHDATHGWEFKNGDKINLLVGKKATITVTVCKESKNNPTITASNEVTINAYSSTDGDLKTINYEGESGILTLTINATGSVYIHSIKIANTGDINYKQDGSWFFVEPGNVSSLLNVIEDAHAVEGTNRVYIYIPNGTYDLGTTTRTTISRNNISIIGESMEKTIIKNRPVKEGIAITATLLNTATNTYLQDLTLDCIAPYGTGDDTKSAERGVCFQDKGNQTIMKNVYLKGLQDTYYSNNGSGTFYFEECKIEGSVDYVCGNGDVYFNKTLFYTVNKSKDAGGAAGGVIAAPNTKKSFGYIFNECTLDGMANEDGAFRLGRPWASGTIVRMLNTKMLIKPKAAGWDEWSTNPSNQNSVEQFAEYNSIDKDGNPVDLSQRKTSFKGVTNNPIITKEEAAKYTPEAIFNSTWKPASSATLYEAPVDAKLDKGTITWSAINGDIAGYGIFADDELLAIVTEGTSYVLPTSIPAARRAGDEVVYTIRVANKMGGFGPAREITDVTAINKLKAGVDAEGNGSIYNLAGQKVDSSYKGIVIKNGKKVIVK